MKESVYRGVQNTKVVVGCNSDKDRTPVGGDRIVLFLKKFWRN
jgi:hypothetical protein